jgi:HPr kinase/phosphorylase
VSPPAGSATRIHGTLVEVAGTGVLMLGASGIGKSECAVELVRRGHRLVADDVVNIHVDKDGDVVGESPELVRHYIELRGIGIVHVPSLFSKESVADRSRVQLVVQLEIWGEGEIERIGLERQSVSVAGVDLPSVLLPVAPGRNVATLVEVATRNHRLQSEDRSAAGELDDRVLESLRRNRE